ncbi:MAG: hypothetical protein H0W65_09505 [Sphingomonas sp.]|uniref:hypothetical protein n=1 Tax=Sphingomonas sp. TaxID=28214 RepID=UPI001825236D|nr:hypothetical protein [Sphingomonas sp.]MBA3667944.1 hypothetical protein [Sphingomonas sp.]
MNNTIDNLRRSPLPGVIIEQWTLVTGWPGFRVYLDAPTHGFDGDALEHYVECEDHTSAEAAADVLSKATGWPVYASAKPRSEDG